MKKFYILLMMLAASLPAAIDDPERTDDQQRTNAPLTPQVTPSAGASEILDPAPPARMPATKEVKTSVSGPVTASDLGKYRSIVERSPFRNVMVPQSSGGAATANAQLRLNGIIRIGDQVSAGIEDTVQRRSLIVTVGRTEDGIEVQSIDELNQTVSLVYNGQAMTLAMDKTPGMSGVPMPVAPGLSPAPSPGGVQGAGEPQPTNIQPPGSPQQPVIKRKRIIIPRER